MGIKGRNLIGLAQKSRSRRRRNNAKKEAATEKDPLNVKQQNNH